MFALRQRSSGGGGSRDATWKESSTRRTGPQPRQEVSSKSSASWTRYVGDLDRDSGGSWLCSWAVLIAEVDGRHRVSDTIIQLAGWFPGIAHRFTWGLPRGNSKGEDDVRSRPTAAKSWVRWRVLDDPVTLVFGGRASGDQGQAERGRAHSSREGVLVSMKRLSLTRRRRRRSPAAAGADRIARSDRAGRPWRRMPEAKLPCSARGR